MCSLDTVFIERLWRLLKDECVWLHAWETLSQTKTATRRWITFYDHQRPHTAQGGQPPRAYRRRISFGCVAMVSVSIAA
jgi:transposase InsO family protein